MVLRKVDPPTEGVRYSLFAVDLMGALELVEVVEDTALQLAMVAAEVAIKPRRVNLLSEELMVGAVPICSEE